MRHARRGALLAALLLAAAGTPASAHHAAGSIARGLALPALAPDAAEAVARHRGAIRALADRQTRPDETTRRLANYEAIQRALCLWGAAPDGLADEASTFHECAHAAAAAAGALLAQLAAGRDERVADEARALIGRIARESGPGGAVCGARAAVYDTAAPIAPRWREAARLPPTVLAASGLGLILGAGAWAARRSRGT